jgi:hypothetical protein
LLRVIQRYRRPSSKANKSKSARGQDRLCRGYDSNRISGGPVQAQLIDLTASVEAERQKHAEYACSLFDGCLDWLGGPAQQQELHDVERELLSRLMSLGCALIAVWLPAAAST